MARKHTNTEIKIKAAMQILDGLKSVREVADELNLHPDTVNNWVKAYKEKGESGLINSRSHSSSQTNNNDQRVRELEKKLKEKEMEIEILKKFRAFLKENE